MNSVENFKSQSKLPKTLQCLKSFDAVILTMRKDKDKKKKKEKEKKARPFQTSTSLPFLSCICIILYTFLQNGWRCISSVNNSAEHPSTVKNCVAGRCKLLASSVSSSRSMVILTFATVPKPCPAIVQRAYYHFTFLMVSVSSMVCFALFVLPLHKTKLLTQG